MLSRRGGGDSSTASSDGGREESGSSLAAMRRRLEQARALPDSYDDYSALSSSLRAAAAVHTQATEEDDGADGYMLHSSLRNGGGGDGSLEPRMARLAQSLQSFGMNSAHASAGSAAVAATSTSASAASSVPSSPWRRRVFRANGTPGSSAAPSTQASPVARRSRAAVAAASEADHHHQNVAAAEPDPLLSYAPSPLTSQLPPPSPGTSQQQRQPPPPPPAGAMSAAAAESTFQLQHTVAHLQKQLAIREATLTQQHQQQQSLQHSQQQQQQPEQAGASLSFHANGGPASTSSLGLTVGALAFPSAGSVASCLPPFFSSNNSMPLDPATVQHWNEQVQAQAAANARKVATLSRLLEEQSASLRALRSERGEVLAALEASREAEVRERERLQLEVAHLTYALQQGHEHAHAHAAHNAALHNEVAMVEERARDDIATLLQRIEEAKQDNNKLRTLYVAEKQRADKQTHELAETSQHLASERAALQSCKATVAKYKSKARDLVARVRQSEELSKDFAQRDSDAIAQVDSLHDSLARAQALSEQREHDLASLHRAHEQVREELLDKTRELSALYQQYADSVAKQQSTDAQLQQHLEKASATAAESASPSSAALSHRMQVDLHRALADKQNEIVALRDELRRMQQQQHYNGDHQRSQQPNGRGSHLSSSLSDEQVRELQVQLQVLRDKIERKTEDNLRLLTENRQLGEAMHQLRQQQQQQRQVRDGDSFAAAPQHHHPQQPPPPPHLYKQIVELGEQLAAAERTARDKDDHIGQHSASALACFLFSLKPPS
jgi:hypothetical protein